eukprot:365516-Chlamydomonas_euryale.AAC.13
MGAAWGEHSILPPYAELHDAATPVANLCTGCFSVRMPNAHVLNLDQCQAAASLGMVAPQVAN